MTELKITCTGRRTPRDTARHAVTLCRTLTDESHAEPEPQVREVVGENVYVEFTDNPEMWLEVHPPRPEEESAGWWGATHIVFCPICGSDEGVEVRARTLHDKYLLPLASKIDSLALDSIRLRQTGEWQER